jgi:DNA-binding MarR family transcriptional regulator
MQAIARTNHRPPTDEEDVMTVDHGTAAALSEQVARLHRTFNAMRQQLTAGSPTSVDGVEWAAYGLLFQLVGGGPRRSSALAEASCVDPSTVSRQVAQLVKAGLVSRQSDPEDGRASLLVATERGQAVYAEKQVHRNRLFAHLLAGWTEDEVVTLTGLLTRLNDDVVEQRSTLHEAMSQHAAADPTTHHPQHHPIEEHA